MAILLLLVMIFCLRQLKSLWILVVNRVFQMLLGILLVLDLKRLGKIHKMIYDGEGNFMSLFFSKHECLMQYILYVKGITLIDDQTIGLSNVYF
ncbi:hypothetical protein BDC45DRAFT_506043 [Circinella umbellata]|nr:hypothetical protein BDC45DRAFT_506043 [Circinella umbellata]